MHFLAIVHKDPDSAYGVHFPDAPGCFSAADTLEDVLPNAIQALSLFLEDQTATPRDMASVMAEAADDLRAGAFALAVPAIRTDGRQVRANISMEKSMLDAIDSAAGLRKMTRSAFLALAARNEINRTI